MSRAKDDPLRVFRISYQDADLAVISLPLGPREVPECLTAAEREVCALLITGRSNAEIAAARGTALRTVANQVASIFRKLGVTSRAELVAHLTR